MSTASSRAQSLSPRKRPQRNTKSFLTQTGCYVSDLCLLEGTITLERGCIVHPKAVIIVAPTCSVTFGPGCVVEENAVLHFPGPGNATVGQGNAFQVGCAVDLVPDVVPPASSGLPDPYDPSGREPEAEGSAGAIGSAREGFVPSIGEWNTFAPRSRVKSVRVGDWCTFGPGTALRPDHPQLEVEDVGSRRWKFVPSQSVVYGATSRIRHWDGSGKEHELGVRRSATEFLKEILPKHRRLLTARQQKKEQRPQGQQQPQQNQGRPPTQV